MALLEDASERRIMVLWRNLGTGMSNANATFQDIC